MNTHKDEEAKFVGHKLKAAILANCQGRKIGDKVDGQVSEQVETGLNCSLVICDYGKVQDLYDTSATRR